MRIFYYLSSCNTCKRIAKELKLDNTILQIDVKKNPLSLSEIETLYNIVGNYEDLINKQSQLYKQRKLKYQNLREKDCKNLLLEHYSFLKRPVLLYDNHSFIGNASKTIAAAKIFLDGQ
ncbi:MAG: hypothetical protein CBD39_03200 [Flavobacteriaceae bacterium TMED179]|mgnify:FL=1|nr:MAG: hypothetical protein CBD39_03200 [Flavobacteriaceae bacterium TMED179]|tara:strand:+ start:1701 stop:2057 length:357 start_codon:yes stop_codon:yes gene_type:complete